MNLNTHQLNACLRLASSWCPSSTPWQARRDKQQNFLDVWIRKDEPLNKNFSKECHLILICVSIFGFFVFRGFWLLWLLAFVAFGFRGFRGFCGFWLLWLLAFWPIHLSVYIYLSISIYLSFFLSFWQLFSFLFLHLLFLLFSLQRRNQTRKQASKQASKQARKQASKQASTSCSPLDLVCCWGGGVRPFQSPPRHEICTSSPTPALPRNQYFKVNSPVQNFLTKQICLLYLSIYPFIILSFYLSAVQHPQSTAPATKSALQGPQSPAPATNSTLPIHKVLHLPRNLHFKVHKVLHLPRNTKKKTIQN